MKKIISINLSGRVIPIEDSAYEKLQAYIESLRRYFAREEGRDEIINDIESRISELFADKIRKGAACITDADVEEIMQSMGRPEDLEAEAAEIEMAGNTGSTSGSSSSTSSSTSSSSSSSQQGTGSGSSSSSSTRHKGRLYRDTNDKFIGGVCSGLAAYFNVDPAIVRLLFAIITFGGFGLGFLAYILLWIVLPGRDIETTYTGKRLYRNPDDKMFGGVAGGLAAYFNRSATMIRLIFAAPLIFSIFLGIVRGIVWRYDVDWFFNIGIGSLSGTFILIYAILWMVLPEASSTYEKMEMRGERVDVNSIRQNMKERLKEWGEEVSESAQRVSARATEVGQEVRRNSRGFGHAIGVLFKVFFLFIAGSIAFALLVALIAFLFSGVAWWPINDFMWTSEWQKFYAWGTVVFFLLVPLVGFMIWVFRRIIRVKHRSSYLGWTFGALWTIGWVCAILFTISFVKDWKVERTVAGNEIAINQPVNGKMIVAVTAPRLEYTGGYSWITDEWEGFDLSDDTMRLTWIKFSYELSLDTNYHVAINKVSHGRSAQDAIARASKIQYSVTSKDSILDLANSYAIDKDSKFRGQQIEMMIKIPAGKSIKFASSVNEKLNPVDIHIRSQRDRDRRGVRVRVTEDYSGNLTPNVTYTMTADGVLQGTNGEAIDTRNDRFYRPEHNDRHEPPTKDTNQTRNESSTYTKPQRNFIETQFGSISATSFI
jgi:phage shock protein PspC (stress-responsive transcriptional regulator)